MRRSAAAIGLILGLGWSRGAVGQEAADLQRAERDFRQALADEQAGAWKKAVGELVEARTLARKETPQLLYQLGLCHAKLGELVLAREELVKAAERARIEKLENVATTSKAALAEVQPRIASLALTRPAHGEVTSVTVDGYDATAKLGTSIDLDPGVHRVHVTFSVGPPVDLRETLGDGDRRALAIPEPATPALATAPAGVPAARASTGEHAPSHSAKTAGWVLVGGGGALVVGGGIFWALRSSAVSTLNAACGPKGTACPSSDEAVINRGKLDDALGVAFFAAGGAAALAGAGLLVFGGSHRSEAAVHVTPLVGAHTCGVLLEGPVW